MKSRAIIVLFFLSSFNQVWATDKFPDECGEYSGGNKGYFELLCVAKYHDALVEPEIAIKYYKQALNYPVHEIFNFEVYALLANAYRNAGDTTSFITYRDKFELALSVFVGIYNCKYSGGSFTLEDHLGTTVSGDFLNEIATQMCVGETELLLRRYGKERLKIESRYYKLYDLIKD